MNERYCPTCGTVRMVDAVFCPSCGERFAAPAPPPAADATLVINAPQHNRSGPPQDAAVRQHAAPGAPNGDTTTSPPAAAAPETGDRTLVVQRRDASVEMTSARPSGAGPSAGVLPQPDGTAVRDARAAGSPVIGVPEAALLDRPLTGARQIAALPQGTEVEVLYYRGSYAAVRSADLAGFVARETLAGVPAMPEEFAAPAAFLTEPNVVRVRAAGGRVLERPSRLAPVVRELPAGAPMQLQALLAYFAEVKLADGTGGYIERSSYENALLDVALTSELHGLLAYGAATLVAFIGLFVAWTRDCSFCSRVSGIDLAEGKLILVLLLAAGALAFGWLREPRWPRELYERAMIACGGAVALVTLIAWLNNGGAQLGVFLDLLAGLAMAAAIPAVRYWQTRAR